MSPSLDLTFYALSDPTRRSILARIARNEYTVSEIAEPFDMSMAAVSKHLSVLERAHFVEKVRDGRIVRCRATLKPLGEVAALLDDLGSFWNERLNALERFLQLENTSDGTTRHAKPAKVGSTPARSRKKRSRF